MSKKANLRRQVSRGCRCSFNCRLFPNTELIEVRVAPKRLKALCTSQTYADYQFVEFGDYVGLCSSAINHLLVTTPLQVRRESQQFELDPAAAALAPFALQKFSQSVTFNSQKVRLKSDLSVEAIATRRGVIVQPTDYYSSLCTNEMAGWEIWARHPQRRLFDGLGLMSRDGIVTDFRESACSNHIGVSTLAITADGEIIVPVQPATSAYSANLLVPSGSGSADWRDFARRDMTFQSLLARAMERELSEECGLLNRADVQVNTRVIGFARVLNQGGIPEFFGVSSLNVPVDALPLTTQSVISLTAGDTTQSLDFCSGCRAQLPGVKQALAQFRNQHWAESAFQLFLNLYFLEDYIESFPDPFCELIR